MRLETPGGGGYGEAKDRAISLVAEDVRLGYVTVDAALEDYKVVTDEHGAFDEKATKSLRLQAGR